MKIQLDEPIAWVIGVLTLFFLIAITAMHGCTQYSLAKRTAFEMGLEEIQLEGSMSTRMGRTIKLEPESNAYRQ